MVFLFVSYVYGQVNRWYQHYLSKEALSMVKITLRGWSVSVQRGQATVILRGKHWVTGTWRREVYKIPVTGQPNNKALVKAAIEKSDIKWRVPLFMSFKNIEGRSISWPWSS